MMNETNEVIRKKAEFFKNKNLAVHISKKNNWFHNGFIKEIHYDFLMLIDEIEGEMPIFFDEIYEIQKREDKNDISIGNGGVEE